MLENYLELVNSYLKISTTEKKVFAEVMTDFSIVNEMLDLFDKEDWKNPYLTWFGPTCGMGNFQVKIVERLMIGLKDWQPDPEKRLKHILENQIYVSEIQAKNLFLFINIFDPKRKYNLNYFRGDFRSKEFDNHRKNVWKKDEFSRIVENPPFNQMIDMDILSKSYDLAEQVIFVHPSTWLLDEKNKQSKFIKTKDKVGEGLKQIILFNGNNIFGIALFVPCAITFFDKNKKEKGIKCVDKLNNKNIVYDNIYQINKFSDIDIYPKLKGKILEKAKNNLDLILKDLKDEKFFVNLSQLRGNVDKLSEKIMIKNDFYTLCPRDLKISTIKRIQREKTQVSFNDEKHAINFLNFVKTKFVRFCVSIYKNNQNLYCGEMALIPWLDFSEEWSDIKLYKYYELTTDEIKFIEKFIVDYY